MSYRVCIPTAGTGSRLGDLTKFLNKSLVSIANRPTLAHVIEQFPEDCDFVVALGHKGHLVREFLELAYPERRFFFAEVTVFEGPESGLGLSLLACREYLQQPFIFTSCDTLVEDPMPPPDCNWMAYAELTDIAPYRTLALKDGVVTEVCEKGEGEAGTHHAYIGLAGIHDYRSFWASMLDGGRTAINAGEAHGLRSLLNRNRVLAYQRTWHDMGNLEALARTRRVYQESDAPTILEKANEAIWFIDDQVIKFSNDEAFIENRVIRSREMRGFVPSVSGFKPHMYRYRKESGKIFSKVVTMPLFNRLLLYSETFWTQASLDASSLQCFQARCLNFYREKTFDRVSQFFKTASKSDGTESINGAAMPTLEYLLNSVDWAWLADGLPVRFHGDFHFENILWNEHEERFIFLDWRQDFGGDLSVGDIYYDFAKLMHGLIVSHEIISENQYSIDWWRDRIEFDLKRRQILVHCERFFENWLSIRGYEAKKVKILTALIYLNIAVLHHHPYSLLLFALGKSILREQLDKE